MPVRYALLTLLLVSAGCDSGGGSSSLVAVEGSYRVSELRFTPDGSGVTPADVAASLDAGVTRLELFGSGDPALFVSKLRDEGSVRTDLAASASRSRVTLRAETDADIREMARLLLPAQFDLTFQEGAGELTGSFRHTANLQTFDPVAYQGVPPLSGTVAITLVRQ